MSLCSHREAGEGMADESPPPFPPVKLLQSNNKLTVSCTATVGVNLDPHSDAVTFDLYTLTLTLVLSTILDNCAVLKVLHILIDQSRCRNCFIVAHEY